MAASVNSSPVQRERDLLGQTVLVIGGSSGIGLETARLARAKGADIILTARNPDRLQRAGLELGASIAAFDATDFDRLERFFDALPAPIDHLLVTGPGPYYAPLAEFDLDAARRDVDAHLLLPLQVARDAASKVHPGGTLLFMGGVRGRRPAAGLAFIGALTAASSWRVSPPMSIGCNRSSMRRWRWAGECPSSGGQWCATWASPGSWVFCGSRIPT